MPKPVGPSPNDLLAARCVECRETIDDLAPVVNFGDVQYHDACGPACVTCGRRLHSGEGGWRSEGRVISEAWGYSVKPSRLWCPECLGAVPRDRPRGSD